MQQEIESADVWIPKVMALCPERLGLEFFYMCSSGDVKLSSDCAQWIAPMVSSSPRNLPISSTPWPTQSAVVSTCRTVCEWSSLRTFELIRVRQQSIDWKLVVKMLDYLLRMNGAGFSIGHFKLLVDCVPANANPVGSMGIRIDSPLIKEGDDE